MMKMSDNMTDIEDDSLEAFKILKKEVRVPFSPHLDPRQLVCQLKRAN